MLDPLESFVRQHYISARWNEDRYYSRLSASSQAVLDFDVPQGVAFKLGKPLSPNLRATYLWGIVPDRKSFGAIFGDVYNAETVTLGHFQPPTRSVTEDMETRLGLSWSEAIRQYERHENQPRRSDIDLRTFGDASWGGRRTHGSSRTRDPAPSGWSWGRMVALATGQPSNPSSSTQNTSPVPGELVTQSNEKPDPAPDHLETLDAEVIGRSDALASLSTNMAAARGGKSAASAKGSARDSLLYGQLYQDGSIDFLCSQRLEKNWLVVAAGRSAWRLANSHVRGHIMYSPSQAVCSELSYDSEGQVIGWSSMASFPSPFGEENVFSRISFGGELYYAAKEKTGGLSVGFRLRQLYPQFRKMSPLLPIHTTFTTLINPMMGHVSMAYVSTVRHGMDIACRYDLNLYSQESDMSIGIEYAPPTSEQVLKARWTLGEGLAFLLEGKWNGALVALGLNLQLRGASSGSESWDRGIVTASPKLGIQVQI